MRRRTSRKKRRFLRKLLLSSSSLLRMTLLKIFIIIRGFIKYALPEAIIWFVILGGLITLGELAGLFIALGIPQNIASTLAIVISFSLLIAAIYLLYSLETSYEKRRLTKNKRKGEVRLAHSIAKFFADSSSTEWSEYQDWLHDILLARCQLLDAKCPVWKVKLITYKRLSIFCIVVGISKVKQAVVSMRRSR